MVKLESHHIEIANRFSQTYSNLKSLSDKKGLRTFENCVIDTAKAFVSADDTFDFGKFVSTSLQDELKRDEAK